MKTSVLIPSRNERYLAETVRDVLSKAEGNIEVIVHLDGYWPNPPLPEDPRLILLHRGRAQGMRPGINAAVACSRGEYLCKMDAHVMVAPGFDLTLQENCADNQVVIPRRHRLDPDAWKIDNGGRPPIDYHFLSYPFERPGDETCGLHGGEWRDRARQRLHITFDDEMSSQGSCWFMSRKWWDRIGPLRTDDYGSFVQEFQEIGNETWLGGGEVKVNKGTWYAHLHKGGKHMGRGYARSVNDHRKGHAYCTRHWMLDRGPELKKLIEKFSPVPTWPADLDEAFHRAKEILC